MPVSDIIESGISTIPEDRQKSGLILDFTIAENSDFGKKI